MTMRLDGLVNFRDFGGVATADGKRVRSGRLFRSDQLSDCGPADFAQLEALGIRLVCDLRSGRERAQLPTRWPAGESAPRLLSLDVAGDPRAGAAAFWDRIAAAPDEAGVRGAMIQLYRELPRRFETALPVLLEHLASPDGTPMLIHCHAGKDRTGFAVAMILTVLGVAPDAIATDYLATRAAADALAARSGIAGAAARRVAEPPSPAALALIESVLPEYLEAALATIDADYGSPDVYLRQVGGLTNTRRARLRALLLA